MHFGCVYFLFFKIFLIKNKDDIAKDKFCTLSSRLLWLNPQVRQGHPDSMYAKFFGPENLKTFLFFCTKEVITLPFITVYRKV